jgi:periplasmic divalent cation tolerance protein
MLPSEGLCQVTITAPDEDWLVQLGQALVEQGLCASVHTQANVRTTYRWQGQVHDAIEATATLHTRAALVPLIVSRVTETHPYDVPQVQAVPIIDGNPDYLQWIVDQTTQLPPS